jgi:membrane associated rhomboid family serine protease
MFGRTLETVWGPKRFLFYYIVTGIGAGLVQELVWSFYLWDSLSSPVIGQMTNSFLTIGASGAVFGILLAFGMLFPNVELMLIPIPIPIKAKWFVIGYGVLELTLGLANFSGDPIAHFAHLGGLLFGVIIILYWKKQNKTNGRFY